MKEICDCGNKTLPAKPVRYSAEDRFAYYRRKAKTGHYKKMDLI
jgi:rRNA maturation protein Nop10